MEWSKGCVLFCHITTRIPGAPDDDLLEKKGGTGYPHIVFLDGGGELLARHDGARTVAGFRESMGRAAAFLELRAKVAKGDRKAEVDYFLAALDLGTFTAEQAKARLKELDGMTAEQKAGAGGKITDLEIAEIAAGIEEDEDRDLAARVFLEMKEAGRKPVSQDAIETFWILLLGLAEREKDVPLFEEGLKTLKETFGVNENTKKFFDAKDEILARLKQGGKK